jgi:hypothetical protein
MPDFSMTRQITIDASAPTVHALVNAFPAWQEWSPWEGLDPALKRTYSGPESGVGSRYEWSGNRQAGAGSMEIVESTPEQIAVTLQFLKPFKATNRTTFRMTPGDSGTTVSWTMSGHRNLLMALMVPLFFDKAIGKDFERGLASLKARAEG